MASRRKRPEILDLLLALRAEGISCSTVSVGGVTLDGVVDTRLHADEPAAKAEPRKGMWEERAEALRQMPAAAKDEVPPETFVE